MELNIHSECPKCGEKELGTIELLHARRIIKQNCKCGWIGESIDVQDLLKALTAAKSREAKLEAERDWLAAQHAVLLNGRCAICLGYDNSVVSKAEYWIEQAELWIEDLFEQAAANATEGK